MIGSIGAALIGGYQQNKNIDKQIEANKEENQRNRDWNLNLAKMQNRWNIDQWSRENAYNTPAAQISRMRAALVCIFCPTVSKYLCFALSSRWEMLSPTQLSFK